MTIDFQGRVAIVTGAGSGLGRSHALGLAARGANVVVNDVGFNNAMTVVEEIRAAGGTAIGDNADVANFMEVSAMVARAERLWGHVDILVNNAGVLRDKTFAKMEMADFEFVLRVHLIGSANCTKAVWAGMRERNYGRILLTSSASGIYGNFGQANYGAAKAAMIGLMNVLHLEGAKTNIRVNILAPTARTGMTEGLLSPVAAELMTPELVTPGVLFLVSEDAPSRVILGAGAGVFAVTHIGETPGVYLDESERTPETIAARFAEISDADRRAAQGRVFADHEVRGRRSQGEGHQAGMRIERRSRNFTGVGQWFQQVRTPFSSALKNGRSDRLLSEEVQYIIYHMLLIQRVASISADCLEAPSSSVRVRLDEEHVDVALRHIIFRNHLEGRRPDLLHAVAAERDQRGISSMRTMRTPKTIAALIALPIRETTPAQH